MAIRFICSHQDCRTNLVAEPAAAGHHVECPECGGTILVPHPPVAKLAPPESTPDLDSISGGQCMTCGWWYPRSRLWRRRREGVPYTNNQWWDICDACREREKRAKAWDNIGCLLVVGLLLGGFLLLVLTNDRGAVQQQHEDVEAPHDEGDQGEAGAIPQDDRQEEEAGQPPESAVRFDRDMLLGGWQFHWRDARGERWVMQWYFRPKGGSHGTARSGKRVGAAEIVRWMLDEDRLTLELDFGDGRAVQRRFRIDLGAGGLIAVPDDGHQLPSGVDGRLQFSRVSS